MPEPYQSASAAASAASPPLRGLPRGRRSHFASLASSLTGRWLRAGQARRRASWRLYGPDITVDEHPRASNRSRRAHTRNRCARRRKAPRRCILATPWALAEASRAREHATDLAGEVGLGDCGHMAAQARPRQWAAHVAVSRPSRAGNCCDDALAPVRMTAPCLTRATRRRPRKNANRSDFIIGYDLARTDD